MLNPFRSNKRWLLCAIALTGCIAQSGGSPQAWFDGSDRITPAATNRVFVCHGFGCHYKSAVTFNPRDLEMMRRIIGRPRTAKAERARMGKLVAWAEKRVAKAAGSAGDVGGLDLSNSRVRGQMDCIDEATNTTSYLLVAERMGLLSHHTVSSPVARGFFLDGRYPHATAVVSAKDGTYAVDSWPTANGILPDILPLEDWYARSPTS